MTSRRPDWTVIAILSLAIVLSATAASIPPWIRFIAQIAIAASLASIGVMLLLRAGLLSFGQGLFYFLGAYVVALLPKYFGVSDAIVAVLAGSAVAGVCAVVLGVFTARYRGIFFSMLTLAISMLVYGIATKVPQFGGSDGINVGLMSFFGFRPRGREFEFFSFLFCVWVWVAFGLGAHLVLISRFGKLIDAIDDNEVRIEYLGRSVRQSIHVVYVIAGLLAGAGGALAAISSRHVDPGFAYWTTAGDFIFIVLLSGQASVLSPVIGAFSLEMLRTFASAFFPDQWQLAIGSVMLAIVLFMPSGVDQLFISVWCRIGQRHRPLSTSRMARDGARPS